jgi:hypothetical protein
MDKKNERLEDLPVETGRANEVKGGGVIVEDKLPSLSSQYVSAATVKGFNPQPDPPAMVG